MQQLFECFKGQMQAKQNSKSELQPSSINIYVTNNIQIKQDPAMCHQELVNESVSSLSSNQQTQNVGGKKQEQKNSNYIYQLLLGLGLKFNSQMNKKQKRNQNQWIDSQEQLKIDLRRQAIKQNQNPTLQEMKNETNYVFKSLLRQDYFNQRFKSQHLPVSMRSKECRRIAQNFLLISELLVNNAAHVQQDSSLDSGIVKYCGAIRSKKSSYLLKYFPYQCLSCLRFSNEILIVQCGKIKNDQDQFEDRFSCNSAVCLECALKFYEYIKNENQPLQQCLICQNSLILEQSFNECINQSPLSTDETNRTTPYSQEINNQNQRITEKCLEGMQFSNIKEVEEEDQQSSNEMSDNKNNFVSNIIQMQFQNLRQTDRSEQNDQPDYQSQNSDENQKQYNQTHLDNLIIRDASNKEKEELKIIAIQRVESMSENKQNQDLILSRCSILGGFTPRIEALNGQREDMNNSFFDNENVNYCNEYGLNTNRSQQSSVQLSGIKPKALQFDSPVKSPNNNILQFNSDSTNEQTASGSTKIGLGVSGFRGLNLMPCEVIHEGNNSPMNPINEFNQDIKLRIPNYNI